MVGLAKAKDSDADAFCKPVGCETAGLTLNRDARALGNIATVVGISGAVFLAGGFMLWLFTKNSAPPGAASARLPTLAF
jgi:hypothetical protein